MMLYRTNTPVFSLRREIDRLFDDTFGGAGNDRAATWLPAVDVREDAGEFRFDVELPGVSPEAVEITADNGVLTIRGEKSQRATREGDDGRYHFVERSYGSFTRSFQLPQGVQEDGITASFDHGLLSVRVPKAARPQPRKITIERAAEGSAAERQVSAGGAGRAAPEAEKAERGRREGRKQEVGA